ncbi:MAG TPA: DUF2007 domain-containing protein [Solirubrobacterales bacterium]|nr:DUF2007 domain-containing protein [Solirubrobacterales bacterium]
MSSSTSHRPPRAPQRDAHDGGGGGGDEGGGGGGGGGGGRLVKVGFGRSQIEAEMLQGLLSGAGIPSVLKRTMGFDTPEFLASGPHDVWVQRDDARRAREVLADTMIENEGDEVAELEEERRLARGETGVIPPGKLAFWVGVAAIGALALVWLLYQLT